MAQNTGNGNSQQPISNLEYDFITVLQNKAEALHQLTLNLVKTIQLSA